jgi:hypothetical protein
VEPGRTNRVGLRIFLLAAWLAAGLLVLLYSSCTIGLGPWTRSVEALSVLSLALGVVGFYSGGRQLQAVNIWSFGFALFVGFAGIYNVTAYLPNQEVPYLLPAIAIAYFGEVVLLYGFWFERVSSRLDRAVVTASPVATKLGIIRGTALFTVAFTASRIDPGSNIANQAVFAGGVLLCTSMFLRASPGLGVLRLFTTAIVLVLTARYIFNGFGRLQLGAFGLAIAFALSARYRGRAVKIGILLVSIPVMLYLAQERVAFTATLNPNQGSGVTGFESAVSPLTSFASLLGLHQNGQLGNHWFSTAWASAVFWVPHHLWAGKPPGFGAVLSSILTPQLDGTGNSVVALFQGEWLYSFGLLGLVFMIPIVGLFIRWIDDWLAPLRQRQISTNRDLMRLAVATVFIAGLPDLVWGGTFTYLSRAVIRAAVLIVVTGFPPLIRRSTAPSTPESIQLPVLAGAP